MHSRPDDQDPLFMTIFPDIDGDTAYVDTRIAFHVNQGSGKFEKISEKAKDLVDNLMKTFGHH